MPIRGSSGRSRSPSRQTDQALAHPTLDALFRTGATRAGASGCARREIARAITRRWISRGAFEDRVDLRVAVPALDRVLAHVAVAAEDLDRAPRSPTPRSRPPSACSSSLRRSRTACRCAPIHDARHTSSRAASISVFMSASLNAIAWFSMIGRPNCTRSLRVVERVLVGGARDADRLRADERARGLERAHRRLHPLLLPSRGAGEALVELLLAAEQAWAAGTRHVVEHDLGGVAGADAVLLELLAHASDPGVPGGTTKLAWPREPELGLDRRDHHVHVGDAAVGDPRLGAVEHPLVLGLVVDGARAQRATSLPASGSVTQNAPSWIRRRCRSTAAPTRRSARACRWPTIAGDGERGAEDRQGDAGVAPAHLLADDRQREAGRVGEELAPNSSSRGRSWPPPR